MHVPTHILSGWCAGNLVPRFSARERLSCVVAAAVADVDGLSIAGGQEAYWDYHHVLGHNLAFGLLVCAMLAALSSRRLLGFAVYLALFHLHLLMDAFGSGPGWGIAYFWPFSRGQWVNPWAWEFFSWQNITAAALLLAWTAWVARARGRTPLEALMPELDRKLVALARRGGAAAGQAPAS